MVEQLKASVEQLKASEDKKIIHALYAKLMERKLFRFTMDFGDYGTAEQYVKIVSDIYAFNQTMFWFIDSGIMRLKKLDSENFAAALYDFYIHDNYALYEVYSVNYLQAFLKIDFMKSLMVGHTFRRCKNCKKFFLSTASR